MIFVTVGTQLAFDRLVGAIDKWAIVNPDVELFAQVGPTRMPPRHVPWIEFLTPADTDAFMRKSEVIVSHAGMGSILTALRFRRPIIIMPRQASLREHRNDHQMATARRFEGNPGLAVAWNENDIALLLDTRSELEAGPEFPEFASGSLVERLADFIGGQRP